jgi:hypothetical protein
MAASFPGSDLPTLTAVWYAQRTPTLLRSQGLSSSLDEVDHVPGDPDRILRIAFVNGVEVAIVNVGSSGQQELEVLHGAMRLFHADTSEIDL